MVRPVLNEEWRGKSDKLILLSDLSRILGKKKNYLYYKYYQKTPIGVLKLDGWLYVNKDFAKCIAEKFAIFSAKPLSQILEEIDNYSP